MTLKKLITSASCLAIFANLPATFASAQSIEWNDQTLTFAEFDCRKEGLRELVITGIVTINREDDKDSRAVPKPLKVTCPVMRFSTGAELQTHSELLVAVDVLAGPEPTFRNTRGLLGVDAQPKTSAMVVRKASNGPEGAMGSPNGAKDNGDLLGLCRDGVNGGRGHNANHGQTGRSGEDGENGDPGFPAAKMTIAVGSFETGEEVLRVYAEGGAGGEGAKGGRGEDGGDGGSGGRGGNGGNSECLHAGAHGGHGGRGGDGGHGGNGGRGGDGGDGGAGGDVTFGLLEGGMRPAEYKLITTGGSGGAPGLGGDLGKGGAAGAGGAKGNGGNGLFKDGGDGNYGPPGEPGEDGRPGEIGNAGVKGPDGAKGGTGTWQDGPILPSILEQLKNFPIG